MTETAPLSPTAASRSYLSVSEVGQSFGTPYFLVSTLVAAIIPTIQFVIGIYFNGQCPIDQHIPAYMIVAGACGLALAALSLLLAITFMCFVSDSAALTVVASCGICLNLMATALISVFAFIWFIIGCVWVFSVRSEVQFQDPTKNSYCQPVLYKSAYTLLIITIIWACIQCCISCFRSCFTSRNA